MKKRYIPILSQTNNNIDDEYNQEGSHVKAIIQKTEELENENLKLQT